MVDANATTLVWISWHCAVADARFKDTIVTTNRQKIGLIKCNCSPELYIIIFRSSLEVRKSLLYKRIDRRDISSDQGQISWRLKQHTSQALIKAKWP